MRTRILEAQPVMLALTLGGCPIGLGELGGQGELGAEEESDGDGEPDEDAEPSGDAEPSEVAEPSGDADEPDEDSGDLGIGNCHIHDPWEPNPSADRASMVPWESADGFTAYHRINDAGLCAGEDDWYRYDVESLGHAEHYLYLRALVEDAGLCGEDCDQPVLVAGPEHAMTVEVYRAHDMQLLASDTKDGGVLMINGSGGEAYAHDLLIRVFSPTFAEYHYRLSVEVRNYDGEDECEC